MNGDNLITEVAKALGIDEHKLADECMTLGLNLMLCNESFRRGIVSQCGGEGLRVSLSRFFKMSI